MMSMPESLADLFEEQKKADQPVFDADSYHRGVESIKELNRDIMISLGVYEILEIIDRVIKDVATGSGPYHDVCPEQYNMLRAYATAAVATCGMKFQEYYEAVADRALRPNEPHKHEDCN